MNTTKGNGFETIPLSIAGQINVIFYTLPNLYKVPKKTHKPCHFATVSKHPTPMLGLLSPSASVRLLTRQRLNDLALGGHLNLPRRLRLPLPVPPPLVRDGRPDQQQRRPPPDPGGRVKPGARGGHAGLGVVAAPPPVRARGVVRVEAGVLSDVLEATGRLVDAPGDAVGRDVRGGVPLGPAVGTGLLLVAVLAGVAAGDNAAVCFQDVPGVRVAVGIPPALFVGALRAVGGDNGAHFSG